MGYMITQIMFVINEYVNIFDHFNMYVLFSKKICVNIIPCLIKTIPMQT